MGKEILTFVDTEIEKHKFYKYFSDYLYNGNKLEPLNIMLPKTSAYVKSYDGETIWMYFFIEDDDL